MRPRGLAPRRTAAWLLVGACVAAPVAADVSLAGGSAAGGRGETVAVPVLFEADTDVAALQVDVAFDAAQFELRDAVMSSAPSGHVLDWAEVDPGLVRLIVSGPDNAALDTGELLSLTFRVRQGAQLGLQPLDLHASVLAGPDAMAVALSPDPQPGDAGIEVLAVPIGCETDADVDAVADCSDNCPFVANPSQGDEDGNGVGDACEPAVAVRLGAAFSAAGGELVSVPVLIDAGRRPTGAASFSVSFDVSGLEFVDGVAGACALGVTDDGAGVLDVDLDCTGCPTDAIEAGQLWFLTPAGTGAPELFELSCSAAATRGCGPLDEPDTASCASGWVETGCVRGDVHPDGLGDGLLTLADWVVFHRKLAAGPPFGARDEACGPVGPARDCVDADGAPLACPPVGGALTADDASTLRRLVNGLARKSCRPCLTEASSDSLRLPGDVAPPGRPDGALNVADVLRVLRWAVGLCEPPGERCPAGDEDFLRGDVAPCEGEEACVVRGDGVLDVADVLTTLRAAVGLETLVWPEHELVLRLVDDVAGIAYRARLSEWPAWAVATSALAPACESGVGGLDVAGRTWALTCASESEGIAGPTDLAILRYRAPEEIHPLSVRVDAEVLDAALAATDAVIEVVAP